MSEGLSMSEPNTGAHGDTSEARPSLEEGSANPALTLKQARERAGLHPVAMAAMLKVPVKRIEALEAGRFDELPDMTFARALALSVCRVLKVDPAPILATFPAGGEVRLSDIDRTLNQPLPSRKATVSGPSAASINPRLSWPVGLAVLLAVVALVMWFYVPAAPDSPALVEPVSRAPESPVPAPEPASAVPVESTTAQPSASLTEVTPATLPPTSDERARGFVLRAVEASWVQVTGSSGRVLVQRSLQPGEVVALSADFPLTVVVGRADTVEVSLRGQAFDMTPHTRNNVARFEVN